MMLGVACSVLIKTVCLPKTTLGRSAKLAFYNTASAVRQKHNVVTHCKIPKCDFSRKSL